MAAPLFLEVQLFALQQVDLCPIKQESETISFKSLQTCEVIHLYGCALIWNFPLTSVPDNFQSQGDHEEFWRVNSSGSLLIFLSSIHFVGSGSQLSRVFDLRPLSLNLENCLIKRIQLKSLDKILQCDQIKATCYELHFLAMLVIEMSKPGVPIFKDYGWKSSTNPFSCNFL